MTSPLLNKQAPLVLPFHCYNNVGKFEKGMRLFYSREMIPLVQEDILNLYRFSMVFFEEARQLTPENAHNLLGQFKIQVIKNTLSSMSPESQPELYKAIVKILRAKYLNLFPLKPYDSLPLNFPIRTLETFNLLTSTGDLSEQEFFEIVCLTDSDVLAMPEVEQILHGFNYILTTPRPKEP